MAVDAHGLNLLRYAAKHRPLGETLTLGRLNLHISPSVLARLYGTAIDWRAEKYCERLLLDFLGASSVTSIDNSAYEGATIVHDMNEAVPASVGEYDTVIDFGTIEHIFDISQALRNMVRLCKPGGQILHLAPANNFCGHGFWQVSPELFFSLYSQRNGFAETEVFLAPKWREGDWYRVKRPPDGERVPILSSSKLYAVCRTVLADKSRTIGSVQQSDYLAHWRDAGPALRDAGPAIPAKGGWLEKLRRRTERIRRKYRYPSTLNPNLTKVRLRDVLREAEPR